MNDIVIENHWNRCRCHYSSIQELVDFYIQSEQEDCIVYALEDVAQFNKSYRNLLQDNGFVALIAKFKSETSYLKQHPEVEQKLEGWWKDIQKEGGLGNYDIQCYGLEDTFSLFGMQINGLMGLRRILQMRGEAGPCSRPSKVFEPEGFGSSNADKEPDLYAALLYRHYPRFDISDYSDNREYQCYYVRNHPINDDFFKDSSNGGMAHINEKIPLSQLPLVYRDGNSPILYVVSHKRID